MVHTDKCCDELAALVVLVAKAVLKRPLRLCCGDCFRGLNAQSGVMRLRLLMVAQATVPVLCEYEPMSNEVVDRVRQLQVFDAGSRQ